MTNDNCIWDKCDKSCICICGVLMICRFCSVLMICRLWNILMICKMNSVTPFQLSLLRSPSHRASYYKRLQCGGGQLRKEWFYKHHLLYFIAPKQGVMRWIGKSSIKCKCSLSSDEASHNCRLCFQPEMSVSLTAHLWQHLKLQGETASHDLEANYVTSLKKQEWNSKSFLFQKVCHLSPGRLMWCDD